MFFSSDAIKIYFCSRPTAMRMSFNGLYGIAKSFMGHDPMSGALFVFRNKRGNRLKILLWDRNGFVIWYKLLPKGTFRFPSTISGNIMSDNLNCRRQKDLTADTMCIFFDFN